MKKFAIFALYLAFTKAGFSSVVVNTTQAGLSEWNGLSDSVAPFNLDVDDNGTTDFVFSRGSFIAMLTPSGSNRVISLTATDSGGGIGAAVISVQAGAILGEALSLPKGSWHSASDIGDSQLILGLRFEGTPDFSNPAVIQSLANDFNGMQLTDGYIGIEFQAADGTHYGWVKFAGFSVAQIPLKDENGNPTGDYISGLNIAGGYISSWAWETEAGKAITVGAVPEPSTLLMAFAFSPLLLAHRRRR